MNSMNPDIKAKWIARLRSGLPQTKGMLRNDEGFCCLGVLCEIAVEEGVIPTPEIEADLDNNNNEHVWFYENSASVLPPSVVDWAGTGYTNPDILLPSGDEGDLRYVLASLNDSELFTFDQIADLIEFGL